MGIFRVLGGGLVKVIVILSVFVIVNECFGLCFQLLFIAFTIVSFTFDLAVNRFWEL